jgi:hypothetical protein
LSMKGTASCGQLYFTDGSAEASVT